MILLDAYVCGSTPGSIQFINFTEFKKLSDFQVTKRNPVTKGEFEFPAPLRVEKVRLAAPSPAI